MERMLLRVEKAQTTGDKSALCPQCDQRQAGPWAQRFVSEIITSHLLSHFLWVVVTVEMCQVGGRMSLCSGQMWLLGAGGAGTSRGVCPFHAGVLLSPSSILSTVRKVPLFLIRCPRINLILILNLIKNRFPLIHLPSGSEIETSDCSVPPLTGCSSTRRPKSTSPFITSPLPTCLGPVAPVPSAHSSRCQHGPLPAPGRSCRQLLPHLKFPLLCITQTWASVGGCEDDQCSHPL